MRKFEKKRNKNFAGIQFENWPIERISIPLSFPSYSSITNRSTLRFERRKEEKTERNEINRESLLFSIKTILQKKEHASSLEMQFRRGKRRKRGYRWIYEMYRTKMREQQLSGWPPREPDTRRFVEKKEHRGDGETAIRPAAGAGRKNRQRTAFVDGRRWRIDRLFAVLRLAGRKIRDWLAAVRNATRWTRCESSWPEAFRRPGGTQNSCDYDRSCPTIVVSTLLTNSDPVPIWGLEVEKYKSLVSFSRMSE